MCDSFWGLCLDNTDSETFKAIPPEQPLYIFLLHFALRPRTPGLPGGPPKGQLVHGAYWVGGCCWRGPSYVAGGYRRFHLLVYNFDEAQTPRSQRTEIESFVRILT